MKRAVLILTLLLATYCAGRGAAPVSAPGHGAISIQVIPNPIVATHVRDDAYSFPFEVVVRETGGRPVDVSRDGRAHV